MLSAYSKVVPGNVFSDNMVLQQSSKISLYGTAAPNAKIKIATGWGRVYKAKAENTGAFLVNIKTPKAGGPYSIIFDDGEISEIKNILIGEVWLASGQSNMEMKVKGYDAQQPTLNRESMIKHASDEPNIRFLTLGKTPVKGPKKHITEKWIETNPDNVLEFSAVAYEFASKLYSELKVPIGVIVAANSGTRIESWMSGSALLSINDRILSLDAPFSKNSPATMFNTMISTLTSFKIKGVIWYQGEANRMAPGTYLKQFPAMVEGWRGKWKDENLPFYTVEIAPYSYEIDKDRAYITAFFRESQRKLTGMIRNIGIVSTVDVGSKKALHPPDKTKIGKRLALLALSNTYLKKGSYEESVYNSFTIKEDKAIIEFSNCYSLNVMGQQINDLDISGDDQVFYEAKSRIENNKLIVWSDHVKNPKSVRYCFKAYSEGNLYNQANLPIPPFRTDNWSIVKKTSNNHYQSIK